MKFRIKKSWKRRDIILFLERLELYISAGLAIDKALVVSGQVAGKNHNISIDNVRIHVEAGGRLWKGLSKFIGIGRTTAGLIEHGESSGQLVKALEISRTLLQKEDELRSKCIGAMAYPVVIGCFAVLLTVGLVRGVMPQIIPMLKGLQVELPLQTRIVIFISDLLMDYGLVILISSAVTAFIFKFAHGKWQKVQNIFQTFLLLIPLVGNLVRSYSLAVFLRSCGALVESGSPIEEAYARSAGSVPLHALRSQLETKIEQLASGMPLSQVLSDRQIPNYVPPLLAAGEASGTLGISAGRAAGILDRDIDISLKNLTALIEPIMMAGMGATVGAIALSIMMPIYEISKVLQK